MLCVSVNIPPLSLPQKALNIFDHHPSEVIDIALLHLQNAGIELTEWLGLLYLRMKVPILVPNFSYAVPDDDLEAASEILKKIGLPLSPPTKLQKKCYGDFSEKGSFHRITHSTSIGLVQHIVLYPISFTTLTRSELTEETPFHIIPSLRVSKILVPRPSALYASIIRMMLSYTRYDSTRKTLASDLSELIGYHLMGLESGFVDLNDDDLWEALEVDRKIKGAVHLVRSWGWDREWREDEEWFGDALATVVAGTAEIDDLPCKPQYYP